MGRLRMSLTTKIFAGLGIVLFLFIFVDLQSVHQLRSIGDHLRLLKRSYLPLSKLTSLLDSVQQNRKLDVHLFLKADPSIWNHEWDRRLRFPGVVQQKLRLSRRILKRLSQQKLESNLSFLQTIQAALSKIELLLGRNHSILRQLRARDTSNLETRRALKKVFRANERALQKEIGSLAIKMDFRLTQVVLQAERREQSAVFLLLLVLSLAILVGVLVLIFLRISLRRIDRLAEATQRIGQGDYLLSVEVSSRDEIGVLAEEFNRMTKAIRDREHHLEQQSRELESAYQDLRLSSERLRRSERLAAIGQLAAQITHEVRNPLNAIGLNLELLEEDLEQLPNATEALAVLGASMSEVERLTLITEEYLRFASLPTPKLEPSDINVLLRDMMEFLRGELLEQKIVWTLELHKEDERLINVDQRQLRQALLNLIRNAMQATASTVEESRKLILSTHATDNGIAIEIYDNGSGIPIDEQSKIFDPFFSTKEGGSGLGLPLTQQIIMGHGGNIHCESEEGGGTRFLLSLPSLSA